MTCMKCASHCPSRAISADREPSWEPKWGSPSNNPGAYKWYVNADECYSFWTVNTVDCSNCIRVCPYTKPAGALHGVPKFFIRRFPFLNRLWIWADTLSGYDRRAKPAGFPQP